MTFALLVRIYALNASFFGSGGGGGGVLISPKQTLNNNSCDFTYTYSTVIGLLMCDKVSVLGTGSSVVFSCVWHSLL